MYITYFRSLQLTLFSPLLAYPSLDFLYFVIARAGVA